MTRTQASWLRCINATSVLCQPPCCLNILVLRSKKSSLNDYHSRWSENKRLDPVKKLESFSHCLDDLEYLKIIAKGWAFRPFGAHLFQLNRIEVEWKRSAESEQTLIIVLDHCHQAGPICSSHFQLNTCLELASGFRATHCPVYYSQPYPIMLTVFNVCSTYHQY